MVGGEKHHTGRKPGAKKIPDLLRDMRLVYKSPEREPEGSVESPIRAKLRGLYKKNFENFVSLLRGEEGAYRKAPGTAALEEAGPAEVKADLGTERCLELAEKLLRELRAGK